MDVNRDWRAIRGNQSRRRYSLILISRRDKAASKSEAEERGSHGTPFVPPFGRLRAVSEVERWARSGFLPVSSM